MQLFILFYFILFYFILFYYFILFILFYFILFYFIYFILFYYFYLFYFILFYLFYSARGWPMLFFLIWNLAFYRREANRDGEPYTTKWHGKPQYVLAASGLWPNSKHHLTGRTLYIQWWKHRNNLMCLQSWACLFVVAHCCQCAIHFCFWIAINLCKFVNHLLRSLISLC